MHKNETSSFPRLAADGVLLAVSLFWGTSFAIVKEALATTSPANFLFIRFSLACLILLPVAYAKRRSWSNNFFKPGMVVGFFLFGAFLTQAWGLVYTSASRSGFITGFSVILVPLLSILLFRRMPGRLAILGAGLAFSGLYLLTSADQAQGLPFNRGDLLTILCAIFWAGHILALGRFSPRIDTLWLTFLQLMAAGMGSLTWAGLAGELNLDLPRQVYIAALYLAVACTILAYLGQTWAQARTTTTRTAIILSMEPVFAALFAWWWIDERMGLWGWLGAALILSGVIAAELKSNPDVPGGR